jgi:hypothetical protein
MPPGLDRSPRARKAVLLHDVARAPKTRRIISMSTPPEYDARITPARARPIPGVHRVLQRCTVLASPSCSQPMNIKMTPETCGHPSAPADHARAHKMDPLNSFYSPDPLAIYGAFFRPKS